MKGDYFDLLMNEHRQKKQAVQTVETSVKKRNLPTYVVTPDTQNYDPGFSDLPSDTADKSSPALNTNSSITQKTLYASETGQNDDKSLSQDKEQNNSRKTLNALNTFISYFFSQETIEDAVSSVIATASVIFAAQAAELMYLDKAQETFFIYAADGGGVIEGDGFFAYPNTIYKDLVVSRRSENIGSLREKSEYIINDSIKAMNFQSMLQLTCCCGDSFHGFLNFYSLTPNAFTNEDLEQAGVIAQSLGAFITNLKLKEELNLCRNAAPRVSSSSSSSKSEAMLAKFLETEVENILKEQKENILNLGKKAYGMLTPRQNDYYHPALAASATAIRKVEQVQEFLYVTSGKIVPELKKLEVGKILSDAKDALKNEIDGKTVRVLIETDKKLPFIIADQRLLKRVLTALIENALEKTKIGGIFKLGAFLEEKTVELVVWDYGMEPIAKDDFINIFTPFGTFEHTLTQKRGKRFLNLPLVKMYTELMGGKISLESSRENGTIVSLRFPTA